MVAKSQSVALFNATLNITQLYEISHADRLLRMLKNGGWELPKDSQYKFSVENGIEYRRDKKANNREQKQGDNK